VGYVRKGAVTGDPPSPLNIPAGCAFASRCPYVQQKCREERPVIRGDANGAVACHYPLA
jgi:oligopeptide/dipeptide ABC transporter ATP-binding protein